MKRISNVVVLALVASITFMACSDQSETLPQDEVSDAVKSQLINLGFDVDDIAPIVFEDGYLVEGDIYLTDETMAEMDQGNRIPTVEQYRTSNLVSTNGNRIITIYASESSTNSTFGSPGSNAGNAKGGKPGGGGGGGDGYSPAMIAGLDEAIARYNNQNLGISFERVTSSSGADIVMSRLSSRDENRGVLGSAGFPTSSGDPYGSIKMSGILESTYGLTTNGIATIIAHEMGHCIGFRHTDYFNRSISCGSGGDEGSAGVGAIHIPGTPTGASLQQKSWMLSCTDGGNRPFNKDDKTALDYLY
jgi:hypothetical protein